MNRRLTPASKPIVAEAIPQYRKERRKTEFGGCFMCHGLFVKADQSLGCSCQVGYYANLGDISKLDAGEFVNGPIIKYIRDSFKQGYEPFRMCSTCVSRTMQYPEERLEKNISLHVEPSNSCNLWCEICICTDERKSENTPPRVNLPIEKFEKMVRELAAAGINVERLALVGFGEPLFNPDTPRMAQITREVYPNAWIYLDTNANFGKKRAEELANCGIDEIRLALDGVDQATYESYRQRGSFEKAIIFTRHLAEAVRRTGSNTKPIWKYILFSHNDKDEYLAAAIRMATEIGIEIRFDYTVGHLASKRSEDEIHAVIGNVKTGANLDMEAQSRMAREPLAAGDIDGRAFWLRILEAVKKLMAMKPSGAASSR